MKLTVAQRAALEALAADGGWAPAGGAATLVYELRNETRVRRVGLVVARNLAALGLVERDAPHRPFQVRITDKGREVLR
jgi:hypothetical protein